jgi:enamine deaminase RidA (YjgF/YER057c/UK114 family)
MSKWTRDHLPDGTEIAGFYVRAIRVGPLVFVSGTTSLDEKGDIQSASASDQTRITMEKIGRSLRQAGGSITDIVRLTVYVTDRDDIHDVTSAVAGSVEGQITSTLVVVSALAVEGLKVEIEATAVF